MSNLVRWNPVSDLLATSRVMDRMFDQMWNNFGGNGGQFNMNVPAIDVRETDNAVIVHAELPGYKPEQIDVRVEGNVLHLRGEYNTDQNREEGQYHLRERSSSSFQRSIVLPVGVDANKAQAEFENGVLMLTLPKQEEAMPKRINITPKQQQITQGNGSQGNNQNQSKLQSGEPATTGKK